jgi:hypothetical protein
MRSCCNVRYYPGICMADWLTPRKAAGNLLSGLRSEPRTSEYEAGTPSVPSLPSVSSCCVRSGVLNLCRTQWHCHNSHGFTSRWVMNYDNRLKILGRLLKVLPPYCSHTEIAMSPVAQSVQCLTTDWTAVVRPPTGAEGFSSDLCLQTGSGAHPASCTVGTGDFFPRG